ncbi:pilus assembly protein [Variibacter gotjawalensis]|nr:pilus assembly protein [Variibacter gotjawalensis]NIK46658.1 Flp pilus assembly protein TadG [Variibacter gotjawalensis]
MAIMFGFMVIPLIGAAGLSIDYGRATYTRASLQSSMDAAALMLARDLKSNPTVTAAFVQTRGQQYFDAQFNKRFTDSATVTVQYINGRTEVDGKSRVKMTASTAVDTTLMKLVGANGVQISSQAEVVWGIKRLEVALALDNTGSMASSNKMTELKTATRKLLDELYQAAKKIGDVKVAIIPFATDVNVGTSNANATWLDWTAWEASNRQTVCTGSGFNRVCTSQPKPRSAWNGCVWDRDRGTKSNKATWYDTLDIAPTITDAKTLYQAHQADDCPVSILPLTDILSAGAWSSSDLNNTVNPSSTLAKKVNSMTPTGNTNVTIGMAWAWHALTKQSVLTEASDEAEDLEKIVILLTDGDNTENRWGGPDPRDGNDPSMDTRTAQACEAFKVSGERRTIYSVRVINGNADLLRNCATKEAYFYDVKNASQLSTAFVAIAQNLTKLAITQ